MFDLRQIRIFFLAFFYFAGLFFFKYYSNGLGWQDFSLLKFGNAVDAFVFLIIVGGLFRKGKHLTAKENKLLLILLATALSLLLAGFLIRLSGIFGNGYVSIYSYNKVLSLIFLTFSFYVVLMVGIYLSLPKANIVASAAYGGGFVLILLSLALVMNIFYQSGKNVKPKSEKYDVGIILGAAVWHRNRPSPILRARIKRGEKLFKKGTILKVQVTGSNAPGENSEAQVSKNILISQGIPNSKILFENKTRSTVEQIRYVKEHFLGKRIAIISDAFHLARIYQMCDFFNVKANGISSEYKLNWRKVIYYALRDSVALVLFWTFAV